MTQAERILEVIESGPRTVVAFKQTNTWDFRFLAHCEDELDHLIKHIAFKTLAFDLTGVEQISSTLLGIFVSLQRSGFRVELLKPSADVRDVIESTKLGRLLSIDPDLNEKS